MVMRGSYCLEIAFAQSIVINKITFQVVTTVKNCTPVAGVIVTFPGITVHIERILSFGKRLQLFL